MPWEFRWIQKTQSGALNVHNLNTSRPHAPLEHANEKRHRRLIAARANAGLPTDASEGMEAPLPLKTYTAATLPSASTYPDGLVTVSDEDALAFSDGTNWLRVQNKKINYIAITGNYTATDADNLIEITSGSPTVTLETAVGRQGQLYTVKNSGTGIATVDGDGTETIDGDLTKELIQYDAMKIMSNGTNWIIV